MDHIALHQVNTAIRAIAEVERTLDDGLENRLHLRRRAGDYPKNLAGCDLPLQGFLRLGEQAHILDRDDGLAGEGLEEGNLLLGERPGNTARDANGADSVAVSEEGDSQEAPRQTGGILIEIGILNRFRNLYRRSFEDGPTSCQAPIGAVGE